MVFRKSLPRTYKLKSYQGDPEAGGKGQNFPFALLYISSKLGEQKSR